METQLVYDFLNVHAEDVALQSRLGALDDGTDDELELVSGGSGAATTGTPQCFGGVPVVPDLLLPGHRHLLAGRR